MRILDPAFLSAAVVVGGACVAAEDPAGVDAGASAIGRGEAGCVAIPVDATGATVEDSSPCFLGGGDPEYIRTAAAGHGGSLKWTYATDAAAASNYGSWSLIFVAGGTYRIEVHTPAPWAMSERATYQVLHAGTTERILIDQTAADGWQRLGDFAFAEGGAQSIRVDDNTGEPLAGQIKVVFDAIRLTRLDRDTGGGDAGPDAPAPPDGGGCSASGGSVPAGGGLAALVLLGLTAVSRLGGARRRRRALPG